MESGKGEWRRVCRSGAQAYACPTALVGLTDMAWRCQNKALDKITGCYYWSIISFFFIAAISVAGSIVVRHHNTVQVCHLGKL